MRRRTGIGWSSLLVAAALLLGTVNARAAGTPADTEKLQTAETALAVVIYPDEAVLMAFNRALRLEFIEYLMNPDDLQSLDPRRKVRAKLDGLIRHVENILDMHPSGFRVSVRLLPDMQGLRRVYATMYGGGTELLAFYSQSRNTIVVTVEDLNENILAHEVAHAIIQQYYGNSSTPPRVHEILAQFVDLHLKD